MKHTRRAARYLQSQSELTELNKPEILINFTTSARAGAVTVTALSTPPLQMSRKIEVIIYYFKYFGRNSSDTDMFDKQFV